MDVLERFRRAGAGFGRALGAVRPDGWVAPTPCPDWDVRQLVNHVVRGNLNYRDLVRGSSAAEFLRRRDDDALGADPVAAFAASVQECAAAFAAPGALDLVVAYPLRPLTGRRALAVRTADTVVHTWDLARAVGADDALDAGLVDWLDRDREQIYADLPETPADAAASRRFFGPKGSDVAGASAQDRVLRWMGRTPVVTP
jgi:uncharacterized protein (TIGR03086 family)